MGHGVFFIHRGKGKEDHKLYLGRFLVPLTLSTLTGQTSGLRNWYPNAGIIQRITLRKRLSHICDWFRVFLATPVNDEQGRVRQTEPGERGEVRSGRY